MDMKRFLSARGQANVKDLPLMMKAHFDALDDMFDAGSNPKGHINLGTAENRLMDGPILELLHKVQRGLKLTGDNIHYNLFHGAGFFRKAIAEHWQGVWLGEDNPRRLDAENIVATCGCTGALEMAAFGLCEAGDAILIPRPFYPHFIHDIHSRAGVIPVPVQCGPDLSPDALRAAFDEQKRKGVRVRAVLFSSPNNPLGHVYGEEAVKGLVRFCMDRDLDIISDEIYAQTVYDPAAKRISTLKLTPEDYVHRVHVTGGFAKDFALSGFRVGFCHSYNTALVACMRELSYFACVSSHTQALLAALLADPDIHGIIAASNAALKKCHAWFVSMLARHGIAAAPAQAGVFVMADFSRHLEGDGEEAEMTLWRHLYDRLKLNISPGHMFGAERCGQFRMCFAQPMDMLEELDRRLEGLKQY